MLGRGSRPPGAQAPSISVSIGPGCTELTLMLRLARSMAADLVMPRNAHLVALYANACGEPRRPADDEMLTIAPPPARSIAGTTAFMPRKQPSWLIRMCRSHSSISVSIRDLG